MNHNDLKEALGDANEREQKLRSVLEDLIDELESHSSTVTLKNSPCFQKAKRALGELCKSGAV